MSNNNNNPNSNWDLKNIGEKIIPTEKITSFINNNEKLNTIESKVNKIDDKSNLDKLSNLETTNSNSWIDTKTTNFNDFKNNTNTSKEEFDEDAKEYKKLLWEIENRGVLDSLLWNKKRVLKERISLIKDFKNAEEKIENTNPSLQKYLLSQIKTNNEIKNISSFVEKKSSEYNSLSKTRNRIALWKVLLENIHDWKDIPLETKKHILDVFSTSNDVAMDLWLDLSVLKSNLIQEIKKDIDKNVEYKETLDKKLKLSEENILSNKKRWDDINSYNEKLQKLEEQLKITNEQAQIDKIQWFISKIKTIKTKTQSEYDKSVDINTKEAQQLRKEQIENAYELDKSKQMSNILNEIKETEIKSNNIEINDDLKNIFISEYNKDKNDLENTYREKINNDRYIKIENIKEQLSDNEADIEWFKKKLEKESIYSNIEKEKRKQKLYDELDQITVDTKLAEDVEINADDDMTTRMKKRLQKWKATVWWGLGKLKLKKEELDIEEETYKTLEENKNNRELWKKIKIASSNIQAQIDKIETEYTKYRNEWNYDEDKVEQFKSKISSYKKLKEKINNDKISTSEKKWLLALLWKWEWLWDYIKNRSENYNYNHNLTEQTLTKYKNSNYTGLWKNKFVELYKNWLDSQKFTLIEEFSKLKATIPNFDKVLLTDDLTKKAELLTHWDDETLEKIQKLRDLQEQILKLDSNAYTKPFLNTLEEVKKWKEYELILKEKEKDKVFKEIDRLDIEDHEKETRKLEILDVFNQNKSQIEEDKKNIDSEITQIESILKTKWKFSSEDIKDISKNIDLFSIVGNAEEYNDILDWIWDDIISWNTDFIDFENYKNIKADFYTTSKLNELSSRQLDNIQKNIDSIPSDTTSENLKGYKRKLREEQIRVQWISDKIKKWKILDDEVMNFLSDKSLYAIDIQEENNDLLEKLNKEWILDDEKDEIKKKIAENFLHLQKIKDNKISESLWEDIKLRWASFEIDREEIQKELKNGFDNANNLQNTIFSKYKWIASNVLDDAKDKLDVMGVNFKQTWKVIYKEIAWEWKSVYSETNKEVSKRNQKIDKYVDAIFVSGFAYAFLLIPTILNSATKQINKFPQFLDLIREYVDKQRTLLFGINLIFLFVVVFFSPKDSFHFMNINTHLYTINSYLVENWNIVFSDNLWKIWPELYYKLNVYLFFIFLIVLYKIIIEFLHKYIIILKKANIWIDLLMLSLWKLIVFFIYMTIIFKVNTFIW